VTPRNRRSSVSSPRHITRSVRISRTNAFLHASQQGLWADRVGAATQGGRLIDHAVLVEEPSVPCSHSLRHRFHPKPGCCLALAKLAPNLFSTQSRIYEKHRLEWPIAK